jgi:MarR family transcriptional regulator, organic hydroperoxide resistance regulator
MMSKKPKNTFTRPELLDAQGDANFRTLVHDILAFSSRISDVEMGLGNLVGLPQSRFRILISIKYLQGKAGVSVNAVADHLHFSGPFITSEINKLVADGLVDKSPDWTDRRRVCLKLTPKAERKLEDLKEFQAPVNDVLFESLTREEFVGLRSLMNRLVSHGDEALALLDFYVTKVVGRGQD